MTDTIIATIEPRQEWVLPDWARAATKQDACEHRFINGAHDPYRDEYKCVDCGRVFTRHDMAIRGWFR